MAFVKVLKTKAYFKRYQTAFRRRREGKTDYYARQRLVLQKKDRYNTPKYRLVVRITCSKVICQIIYATIKGDKVLTAADSSELKRFGLTAGLTNYASAYATGLLVARRLLRQLKMDELYKGADKVTGEVYDVIENQNAERRPFKAILDTGLVRTTTGNRVFGALKGAADGGLHVPHSEKRFPGYAEAEEEGEKAGYDAKVHRDRIFGVHVDQYIQHLKSEGNNETYKRQFSKWEAALKAAKVDSVEKLYTKVHAEIRKNPDRVKRESKKNPNRAHVAKRQKRLTAEQRKKRVEQKLAIALKSKK